MAPRVLNFIFSKTKLQHENVLHIVLLVMNFQLIFIKKLHAMSSLGDIVKKLSCFKKDTPWSCLSCFECHLFIFKYYRNHRKKALNKIKNRVLFYLNMKITFAYIFWRNKADCKIIFVLNSIQPKYVFHHFQKVAFLVYCTNLPLALRIFVYFRSSICFYHCRIKLQKLKKKYIKKHKTSQRFLQIIFVLSKLFYLNLKIIFWLYIATSEVGFGLNSSILKNVLFLSCYLYCICVFLI